jgi:hypothetical protein
VLHSFGAAYAAKIKRKRPKLLTYALLIRIGVLGNGRQLLGFKCKKFVKVKIPRSYCVGLSG